ncbi:MAG: response regulator, partial [Anaerolineae bacterium]|nr:response regulator [Anaerolineae bacterium]
MNPQLNVAADFDGKGKTVLVIDDNPTNLGIMFEYLENHGFTVLIARDGESGLERARYGQPDLILLDVMMPPGIDGFETCRRLKHDDITRDIPVIMMTALTAAEHKTQGFKAGAVDYVTKPVQHEEVLGRIINHLRLKDLLHNLETTNTALSKVVNELELVASVSVAASSTLNTAELLQTVVDLTKERFGLYHAQIYLLNEADNVLE